MKKEGKLKGDKVIVHNQGGTLKIEMKCNGQEITAIYLEGPTEVVGILEIE